MAITGQDVVRDAMTQARILGSDIDPSAEDSALVLRRLNRMLDSWANESLMIYNLSEQSFTMTPAQASFSTSLLSGGRPVEITSIFVRLSNIDYSVDLVDYETYSTIPYKPTPGVPAWCYVDTGFPHMTLYFYPTPYAAFTCFLGCRYPLTSAPVTLATSLSLPPGYEKTIVDNLAVDIGPSFGKQPDPMAIKAASEAKAYLKRINFKPDEMSVGWRDIKPSPDAFIYRGF